MMTRQVDVAIVGAGLSGLYAAWRLERLVDELGLPRFAQHEHGDMTIERSAAELPVRARGYVNTPASMRLSGGMQALADALRRGVDAARIITGQAVRRLRLVDGHVEIDTADRGRAATTWRARHALLALPPRLAEDTIAFAPPLPPALATQWRATPTWMAPHAKYVAVYDTPFWRDAGLSGAARSAHGPLAEIHDASLPGGAAALFGFLGIPAQVRSGIPDEVLRRHCRAQLARLFGPRAGSPLSDVIKDWASDPFTATAADLRHDGQHTLAPGATAASGPWRGCVTGIASEWSPQFPGYVAGAIEAADLGVQALLVRRDHTEEPT